jgi:PKD repeat protein
MNSRKLFGLMKRGWILLLLAYTLGNNASAQCDANFSFTLDSSTGSAHFTNLSVTDTLTPVFFTWYSYPSVPLSSDTSPVIKFDAGTQHICLVVNNGACSDTLCTDFTMPPVYCKARFTSVVDQLSGNASFTNHSDGLDLSHVWSFGDGGYSTDTNPVHLYASNGWYYVCLNIINSDSTCESVKCEFVQVNQSSPTPCIANFFYQYDSLNVKLVYFHNTTVGDTGVTYTWLFGSDTSDLESPSHLFTDTGFYTVCLLASGPNCADSACKVIEITDLTPPCQASFSYTLFPDSGNTHTPRIVVFKNNSTGSNLNYIWTFGDSMTDIAAEPIHYYPVDGYYKICLTAFNPTNACFDSMCTMLKVETITGISSSYFQLNNIYVYPVPFADVLNLEFNSFEQTTVEITVYDVVGKTRYTQHRKVQTGQNHMEVNLAGLDKGLYFLGIQSGEQSKTVRIVK